jgi:hypothetical protein
MANVLLPTVYISSLTLANLLVAWLGPWFSPINSFVLIGLDLSLRDKLHDQWNGKHLGWKLGAMIVVAGLVSSLVNPASGQIAIASVAAFTLAMAADSIAYHFLKPRSWMQRSNGSNTVGAAVDSLVFPTVAFGSMLPEIVALQFAAKVSGGFVWSCLLNRKFA